LQNFKQQFEQNKQGWIRSFTSGLSQDEDGNFLPWMSYPAINFLQQNLKDSDLIFEFGCGASTLFFSDRVKYVTSLETNQLWFNIIKGKLNKFLINKNNECKIPKDLIDKIDDVFFYDKGVVLLMKNGQFNELYQKILLYFNQGYDYIVIDSLKRFDCVYNSINSLSKNGSIILDDSQRKSYHKIFSFLARQEFKKADFWGIAPGQIKIKNTTFFKK